MKRLIQRVTQATVTVESRTIGQIDHGLLIFIGAEPQDTPEVAQKAARKTVRLRIFADPAGKTNLNLQQVNGQLLVVSQFTLCADTTEGNRPSFIYAAPPDPAQAIYEQYLAALRLEGTDPQTGKFGASMNVQLTNQGPFTIPMQF